jgi:hypothetical protein
VGRQRSSGHVMWFRLFLLLFYSGKKGNGATMAVHNVRIEFSLFGAGSVCVKAKNAEDAIRQFDEMDIKELAGWCNFSSFEESGIQIISIDGEPIHADLWAVKEDMGID